MGLMLILEKLTMQCYYEFLSLALRSQLQS